MKANRMEMIQTLLVWLAVVAFSVAWGVSAVRAEQEELESVWISGGSSVNDGSSIRLTAYARIDGQTRNITGDSRTRWSLSSTTYASISRGN